MTFSRRVGRLPTYPMAELPAIKRRLIEQGVDVIDVGAGDADFPPPDVAVQAVTRALDRKSTRLNSSHVRISYAVFCLKKKKIIHYTLTEYYSRHTSRKQNITKLW